MFLFGLWILFVSLFMKELAGWRVGSAPWPWPREVKLIGVRALSMAHCTVRALHCPAGLILRAQAIHCPAGLIMRAQAVVAVINSVVMGPSLCRGSKRASSPLQNWLCRSPCDTWQEEQQLQHDKLPSWSHAGQTGAGGGAGGSGAGAAHTS